MKKLNKIKLHNLSKDEMDRKEQNLLKGGASGKVLCTCISVCMDRACVCYENQSGKFYLSNSNWNSGSSLNEFAFENGAAITDETNRNMNNHY